MPPPFTLAGFDHVVFLVDDMDRALAFYQEVLGCEPGYSYPAIGMEGSVANLGRLSDGAPSGAVTAG